MNNGISLCYCNRCKSWDKTLMKTSANVRNLFKRQYFMCQGCNRERLKKYYHKNPEKVAALIRKSESKNPLRRKAYGMVQHALKQGRLIKPKVCSECNDNPTRIEAHHEDYEKPLEVIWLCTGCHALADKKNEKKVDCK